MEKETAIEKLAICLLYDTRTILNALYGWLSLSEEDIDNLLNVLEIYQNVDSSKLDIKKEIKDINLEEIKCNLKEYIDSMKSIHKTMWTKNDSLLEFLYNREEIREVDIHDRIERNLAILQERVEVNQKRPKIEILRKYGSLKSIVCYERAFDRVLMHILSNAIDAVEDSNYGRTYEEIEQNSNIIRIETEINSNRNTVQIAISDNGLGIEETYINRIFDPFFTTKSQYTRYKSKSEKHQGMGLFVSRYIVEEKHGGKLTYDSTPGEGSEFTIEIPIQPVKQ